ncbi:flagellar protein FlaG [Ferrovum sp.]|uniref:flagellar protein FlaG n=1 Tax=Ferrovum sp. TaxID=2609467 RepID=UPI002638EEBE|nr:flagellar protein FlaG [Ferrovum sp.]
MVIQTVNSTGISASTGAVPAALGNPLPEAAGTSAVARMPATSNQTAQVHSAQVSGAVQTLNQSSFLNRGLTFSEDKSTHETVVKVVEAQSGMVIAQIPSRQALAIAQSIDALPQKGAFLNQKA